MLSIAAMSSVTPEAGVELDAEPDVSLHLETAADEGLGAVDTAGCHRGPGPAVDAHPGVREAIARPPRTREAIRLDVERPGAAAGAGHLDLQDALARAAVFGLVDDREGIEGHRRGEVGDPSEERRQAPLGRAADLLAQPRYQAVPPRC